MNRFYLQAAIILACALAGSRPSNAEVYACDKGGQKVYSDKPCGDNAKEISGKFGGVMTLDAIPDAAAARKLCQISESYSTASQNLQDRAATEKMERDEYNAGVMENSRRVHERLQVSEKFRCMHPQLVSDLQYIVTSGYPFSKWASRHDKSSDSSMQYCLREIQRKIEANNNERPVC